MISLALVTFVSKPTYPFGLATLKVHHLAQISIASFEAGCLPIGIDNVCELLWHKRYLTQLPFVSSKYKLGEQMKGKDSPVLLTNAQNRLIHYGFVQNS